MSKEEFIDDVLPVREKLVNYAISFLKSENEAEDIIQEVFIRLWIMRHKLNEYTSVDALSFTITKNLCLNRIKIKQREFSSELIVMKEHKENQPDIKLMEKDNLNKAMLIVNQLPSLQQAILKMRHMENLEIKEIAKLTGTSVEAVRVNLSRARKRVRTMFVKIQEYESK